MERKAIETNHCVAFMNRLNQYHPDIAKIITHIPNENKGYQRTDIGIKKGFPDYILPLPMGGYGSLFIEFKSPKGKLSEDQKNMISLLVNAGNKVVVVYSWDDGVKACLDYISQNS